MHAMLRGSSSLGFAVQRHACHRAIATSGAMKIDFGRHSGKTFDDVYRQHPDYCDWVLKQTESTRLGAFRDYVQAARNGNSTPSSASNSHLGAEQALAPPRPPPPPLPPALPEAPQNDFVPSSSSTSQRDFKHAARNDNSTPSSASNLQLDAKQAFLFGKHEGKSFEHVCRIDPDYCQYMLQVAAKPDSSQSTKVFARFVEERFPEILKKSSPASTSVEAPSAPSKSPWQKDSTERQPSRFHSDASGRSQGTIRSRPRYIEREASSASTTMSSHPEFTVESGSRVLNFGTKHSGKTYAEIFEKDQQYCQWIVDKSLKEPMGAQTKYPDSWPFIAYVLSRWLKGGHVPPADVSVTGKRNCLEAANFVITGIPAEMDRQTLEELIIFFGGSVRSQVNSKTTCVIVGAMGQHGKSVEFSTKYRKAQQLEIPIVTVEHLLEDLAETAGDGDEVTFSSEHSQHVQRSGVE